jgi:hypothetical protein
MFPCCNLCYEKYIEIINDRQIIKKQLYINILNNHRKLLLTENEIQNLNIKDVCLCKCHEIGSTILH